MLGNSSQPLCGLGERQFISLARTGQKNRIAILDGAGTQILNQPEVDANTSLECAAWRRTDRFLMPVAKTKTLTWVSSSANTPPQRCRTFDDEIQGHAVSPDGTLVAVITATLSPTRVPEYLVYVNLLAAEDCRLLKRELLRFPKQSRKNYNGEWTDYLFNKQLARHVAISPDNKLLAFSYGVFERPNGQAYFGLYSLASSDFLAALKGNSYKCSLLRALVLLSDETECEASPITGPLRFSPDSRTLFTSSDPVQQWHISALR